MKNINEESSFKPTISKPVGDLSKGYDKNFKKSMNQYHVKLNETDELLTEKEQSLKKKIFSLAKMESLVFADPKLSTVYNEMAENGEEKYGYHYNETIMNMIFNDYVLNSSKYLQKYKMAIPKKKKRRDKSGINQLKKSGVERMHVTNPEYTPTSANETTSAGGAGAFVPAIGFKKSVEETTGAASSGAYAGPAAWGDGDLMKGNKSKVMRKPIWDGGTIIQESNYLIDPSGFAKYVNTLDEQIDIAKPEYSQQPNVKSYANKSVNDKIIDKTAAFSSNTVKQWDKPDTNLELHTINNGTMDEPNLKTENAGYNNPDMYSTKEDLKHLIEITKQKTGRGLQKEHIPMLAGEALYTIAIRMADRLAPIGWDEMGDTNSMWDYIDKNGGMSFNRLLASVKEAVSDRMGGDDMSFGLDEMNENPEPNFYQNLDPKKAIEKATVDYIGAMKKNNQGQAEKVAGNLKSHLDSNQYDWKQDPYALEMLGDYISEENFQQPMEAQPIPVEETSESMIGDSPDSMSFKVPATGTVSGGAVPVGLVDMKENTENIMKEDMDLFEELNKELNAYSIHHNKLKKMAEDRKPSSLVLKDRLGSENQTNFKKDLQHSGTKEIINVEKELMWKDEQTDVPTDPMKLGQDIENAEIKTTKGEAFKNVGNSANDKGDEVPKRNLTTAEQDEVNVYRKGMHSLVYDNKPDQRFEDRMKADMGDNVYEIREKQMAEFGKAPMYNKEAQPTQATKSNRTEFDKEKSGWNDPNGLSESMVTGRYRDALNKSRIIDFTLNEVMFVKEINENLFSLDFTGLGNSFNSKSVDYKVSVNETVVNVLDENKFYTNGKVVYAIKNPKQNLSEAKKTSTPVLNEEMNKMKHLLGYNTNSFVNTNNTKKNRGF